MITFDEACEIIAKTLGVKYFSNISDHGDRWAFAGADEYGEALDDDGIAILKESGKILGYSFLDYIGQSYVELEVPQKWRYKEN